jgi:D-3-phosphoglycerate dehydrogenase
MTSYDESTEKDKKPFRVAITIRSFSQPDIFLPSYSHPLKVVYQNNLQRRLNDDEIVRYCQEADAVIAGTERFTREVMENLPALKVISRIGVGTDSIDLEYAQTRGIVICTTPDSPVVAVAEHTLALILAISRNIQQYSLSRKESRFTINPGHIIKGKTAGIIGLGKIGKAVASLLNCFGAEIQYYDPFILVPPDQRWRSTPSLSRILMTSDIISLHLPPLSDKNPLLGEKEFATIKKGAILINTARGSLLDEKFLVMALESERLAGAGLDVTQTEPYHGPLLEYPQVIITPHIASNTYESRKEMEIEAINNIIRYLEQYDE